ncbi:DUF4342 domain-containing protein [Umezawaea sp. Da 62-37]|uniref:DUF4342 domain-containing protein n=1 Tax=Umezawaea sp. Da 62-37 TaxID=3075927 RepID=UPI0028F6DDF9|nr:DUF4342 domain-containing protein [Umezawaea sp. Da 62-37]WNV84845.1 DUF4342 domain-containing protein [Umezawaea sp. Da 62-37]
MATRPEALGRPDVRTVVLKDHDGYPVVEIPLIACVLAAAVAPVPTAIGALAALANDWSIGVEHEHPT